MFEGWYLCIIEKSFYCYSWLISSHARHNMIQKSWTKVSFIQSQLDLNVLYDMLQSMCKWKSPLILQSRDRWKLALTIHYNWSASENGSLWFVMFHVHVNLHLIQVETRIQCNFFRCNIKWSMWVVLFCLFGATC